MDLPIVALEISVDQKLACQVHIHGPVGGTERMECAFSCREEDERKGLNKEWTYQIVAL